MQDRGGRAVKTEASKVSVVTSSTERFPLIALILGWGAGC